MLTGQLFTVRPTPYGGRGVYAQTHIKAGTCVQHCPAPFAYVIARKFRKEVCAWCFKYAFEHGRNTWGWKYEASHCDASGHFQDKGAEDQNLQRPQHKTKVIGTRFASVSFCSAECRSAWYRGMDFGGLYAALGSTLEKLAASDKQRRTADVSSSAAPSIMNGADGLALLLTIQKHWTCSTDVLLYSIHHREEAVPIMSDTPITTVLCQTLSHQEQLDRIWKQAEVLYTPRNGRSRHFLRLREEQLTELELDMVQFVISALVRHFSEVNAVVVDSETASDRALPSGPGVMWSKVLDLQNNEVQTALRKPEIIAAHLRVYGFVRQIVETALEAARTAEVGNRNWAELRTYVEKSDFIRAVLGRDHGNVFGIWDMASQGDSEMLGWGMYVQGSYFNHGRS